MKQCASNVAAFEQRSKSDVKNRGTHTASRLCKFASQPGRLKNICRGPRVGISAADLRVETQRSHRGDRECRAKQGTPPLWLRIHDRSPLLWQKDYFLNSWRCRCSLTAVVRSVSGMFLLVQSRFKSMALIIGNICKVTSSGVFGLLSRLRTTV